MVKKKKKYMYCLYFVKNKDIYAAVSDKDFNFIFLDNWDKFIASGRATYMNGGNLRWDKLFIRDTKKIFYNLLYEHATFFSPYDEIIIHKIIVINKKMEN